MPPRALEATSVTIVLILPLGLGTVHGTRWLHATGMHQLHEAIHAVILLRVWSGLRLELEIP